MTALPSISFGQNPALLRHLAATSPPSASSLPFNPELLKKLMQQQQPRLPASDAFGNQLPFGQGEPLPPGPVFGPQLDQSGELLKRFMQEQSVRQGHDLAFAPPPANAAIADFQPANPLQSPASSVD